MAGAGSGFVKAGYKTPKPFIDVLGKPMIMRVLENLSYPDARYILITRKEYMEAESKLVEEIKNKFNVLFIPIDKLTEGTASTVLYARKYINNDVPLLIANSDQLVDMNIADYINECKERKFDGSILTFIDKSCDIKWSFAKIDGDGLVTEVKEKVGIYYFYRGKGFVDSALESII